MAALRTRSARRHGRRPEPDRERVGLHDLRHTLIGLAFEHGLTLPEASILARRANPRVTAQVYAGLSEKARERVAEKLAESGFRA